MRRYPADEEQRIRTQELVREWTRSGLLDAAQGQALSAALRVALRRTNPFLRAGLALFTALIVAAFVWLMIAFLELRDSAAIAAVAGLAAAACIGIAEVLVANYRWYRFGVEETFAVAAVALTAFGAIELASALHLSVLWLRTIALLVGAVGSFALYRRFGFIYAAIASFICVATIPFQLDLSAPAQRALSAAAMSAVFIVARSKRLEYRDDFPGDEYGDLQAAALAGIYLVLNLQITGLGGYRVGGWFYWCTYAMTWILPAVGLRLGIGDRDRELMDVGLLLAIVTLVTSKPYLGWPRNTWDPIVFGVALMALALAVRRWLDHGPDGERRGITASRLLDRDRAALSTLSIASALVPAAATPGAPAPRADPPSAAFDGGRSGGGGGGDRF
jgi:hypothetical protein